LETFNYRLVEAGKITQRDTSDFRIACYSLDGIYRMIADALEHAPKGGKPVKHCTFYFPRPGQIVDSVLKGGCQVGVDSEAILKDYDGMIEKHFFHRSRFQIVAGSKSPLFGRESISTEEVVRDFGSYGAFIPDRLNDISVRGKALTGAKDLIALGGYTLPLLPCILPLLSDPEVICNGMLLLPEELSIGYSKEISAVRLEDESIATDYMLFWKKGEDDPDLGVFVRLIGRRAP